MYIYDVYDIWSDRWEDWEDILGRIRYIACLHSNPFYNP